MPRQSSITVRSIERQLFLWSARYGNVTVTRQAEALALRRDMVTLLEFVRDNRVIGTQSTGNMPLKAVREVVDGPGEQLCDHVVAWFYPADGH